MTRMSNSGLRMHPCGAVVLSVSDLVIPSPIQRDCHLSVKKSGIQFNSIQFNSVQFMSVHFNSIYCLLSSTQRSGTCVNEKRVPASPEDARHTVGACPHR